jgi:hypothetical protein
MVGVKLGDCLISGQKNEGHSSHKYFVDFAIIDISTIFHRPKQRNQTADLQFFNDSLSNKKID